ncbi:hypothetical protein ABPG75_001129 [Micractinium tetrahymenae]
MSAVGELNGSSNGIRRGSSPSSSGASRSSAAPAAAAPRRQSGSGAARRAPPTMAELRTKAAFRACDRLMERGAADEAQLWSVARVMSGTEYEQAAEERSLAGKCGNPLCTNPPPPPAPHGGGRYGISAAQQAVYDKAAAAEAEAIFCSTACAAEVRRFAARLGSGAQALERFSAMYEQLRQQDRRQQAAAQQPHTPPQEQRQEQPVQHEHAFAVPPAQAAGQQQPGMAGPGAAAAGQPQGQAVSASSACIGVDSEAPGGICSSTTLAPRLAVEQVEVKRIDSSAGQFGDFSRKPRARPADAAGSAAGGQPLVQRPKGVLKKQSQFAAGTAKVPIMLAEVKERDPSMVAAATARSLPADARPASARGKGPSATAVEGYVPRSIHSRQKAPGRERQRRVRWRDEVEDGEDAATEDLQRPAAAALQQEEPEQQGEQQQPLPEAQEPEPAAARDADADADASHSAPAHPLPTAGQQDAAASSTLASTPVLFFEVEEPSSTLEAGQAGLESQFGRLRVADAASLPIPTAATTTAAAVGSRANGSAASSSPSSSIDIQRPGTSGGGGGWSVPPEWREAPQFYAHSPVGSSSSLASWASPGGGANTLAAAASSPPPKGSSNGARPSPAPPGLPRPPSVSSGRQQQLRRQQQQQAASLEVQPAAQDREEQQQQQQQEQAQQAAPEQPFLTKRQAEQLQRAFPPLSAALPPELQAVLASDSETESEAADSEDWMRSDDEDAELGISSEEDDEMVGGPGRSGYRIQLSFFGTLFTHLEAWVTPNTAELLAAAPDVELVLPPPPSPEVLATLARFLAAALPPVLSALQSAAPRGEVERSLDELLRTLRLVGPLPAFKVTQWQVVALLLLKALSLERCPPLRPAFESREGIGRLNQLLGRLGFTSEEFYAALELLCPVD